MNSHPWFLRISGRRMVPLLLFVFAFVVIALHYRMQLNASVDDVVKAETVRLRERLNIDEARLNTRLGLDDRLFARRLVGALALYEGVDHAYLIDQDERVLASLSRLDLGRRLTEVISTLPQRAELETMAGGGVPRALDLRPTPNSTALNAVVPLQDGHRLLVWQDLRRPLALRRVEVQDEVAREAVMVLVQVGALALVLHFLWFRRARQVAQSLESIGAGDLSVRTGLVGRDELALIGGAADRMAQRLEEDQQRLRHMNELINRSPAVVIEWANQPGWPMVQVSDAVRQWGYEPRQLLKGELRYNDLIHPEDSQRIHSEVAVYFAHGPDSYRQEYRIRCADGRWAWVDDRTTLTRGPSGEVLSISGVLLDVTAQKDAELARHEQAEQLRMFYELPFLGMAISSPVDKRWLQVNDRLCEMLGYSREELLRMTWAEMTPADDLVRNVKLFDEMVSGQREGYQMSKKFLRKDGGVVHAEIDVRALRDGEGRLTRLFATVQDVTERKAAEEALRNSQEQLAQAQRIGRMGSWTFDHRRGEVAWSDETFRLQGLEPRSEKASLERALIFVHPDERPQVEETYRKSVEQGTPYEMRYRICLPDGATKHIHARGETLFEDEKPVLSVGMVVDETDLVQAQRERDRLISVMETTSDIVSMADAQGNVFYLNRAGYDRLGLPHDTPPAEVIARVHPRWAAELVRNTGIPTALRDGQWLGETAVYDARGDEIPMSQLIMAHRGEDGRADYVWTILRDVSELRQAREALRRSEQRYALAAQIGRSGVWEIWPEENRIFYDGNLSRLFGYRFEEMTETLSDWSRTLSDEGRPVMEAALAVLRSGKVSRHDFMYPMRRKDGSGGWIQIHCERVSEPGEKPMRWVGTSSDITDRVHADQALRSAKDLLEQAESVALLGSWSADAQTQRLVVSDQLFRNLGLEPGPQPPSEEAYLERLHPEDRSRVAQDMATIRQGGEASDLVFRTNPAHGPVRWLRRTVLRFDREAQKLMPRYIGTLQDITEAVHAEEQLRRVNQELEQRVTERTAQLRQANQELEAFSYTVSHDLKAPLRGIDGYSQLLLEEYENQLDDSGRLFVQRIRQGVQLMGELISDLLEYSRMERRDMAAEPVAMQELVANVLEGFQADIERQHARVQIEMDDFTMALDREGIAVVMRNLIGNALKFSRDRHPPVIDIGSRVQDGRRLLWVRDNGVGFDMKYHDRMFGIFQRLHRAEEFPGTGVGLALVAKAVQRMGGRVWGESVSGSGATFYLEFPL